MQRVKLLQMGIVGHSEYEAKKAQEMARIKKHEEKTAKSEAAAPGGWGFPPINSRSTIP